MNPNEQIIFDLYSAFQDKDYLAMAACYSNEATFKDEAFDLKNGQVSAMWHYLIANGKDLSIAFENIKADSFRGSAHWEARYTFSRTGRKVHNIIEASFEFKDGKIIRHIDRFDFWRWSRQALGTTGFLLGWSGFLKNKVRQTAQKGLDDFISGNPRYQ